MENGPKKVSLGISDNHVQGYPKNGIKTDKFVMYFVADFGGMSGRQAGASLSKLSKWPADWERKIEMRRPFSEWYSTNLSLECKIHSNAIGIEGFTWRIWNRHKYKMKNTIPAVSPWSHRHFDDLMVNRNPHGISRWARPVWNTSRHYIREYKCKCTFK